jgi:Cu2+-exporting ATPase
VASISTTKAAKNGFLVKQRMALESARNIDVVLFDKTGTLTTGEYGVSGAWSLTPAMDEREVVRLASAVDARSEHPAAKAIVKKAGEYGGTIPAADHFQRLSGKGSEADVLGRRVKVGGKAILGEIKISLPNDAGIAEAHGETIIYVMKDEEPIGIIALRDVIRGESREAVTALKAMGIEVVMMTGDAEDVAGWVSKELHIDQYFARVLPGDKAGKVKLLQAKGKRVAMVGDGVNDAPALTQADLGIAIGAGTNVAIESAGIILVRNDPRDIAKVVKLSRLTYRKMIQNIFWAAGYNVVAMPLAAGALAAWGVMLQPAIAALLMSLSTIIVAANAVLLRRAEL